ncbi:MAG: hypothetical protein JWO04_215 [Gammaproteobacteria bacterium]|nr:hypothetical protein [Gammaproteobacteria bacterium]
MPTETSHTTVAQSFGAGLILPLWGKWLELHATTLTGHGNGRYGLAQLSDATYNTRNGWIAALREQQGLVGLIAHPSASVASAECCRRVCVRSGTCGDIALPHRILPWRTVD